MEMISFVLHERSLMNMDLIEQNHKYKDYELYYLWIFQT